MILNIRTIALLLSLGLMSLNAPVILAQEAEAPDADSIEGAVAELERLMAGHAARMDQAGKDQMAVDVLANSDPAQIPVLAEHLKETLDGALTIRVFVKGSETMDQDASPPCSYACLDMMKAAYQGPVEAEALLFNSPDAHIIFVRAVTNEAGDPLGVIVAQFPFQPVKDAIGQLAGTGGYVELQQSIAGKTITINAFGDKTYRSGEPEQSMKIANTSWAIAQWPASLLNMSGSGGEGPPWLLISLGGAVVLLLAFIGFGMIAAKKEKARKAREIERIREMDTGGGDEGAHRTKTFGGGAIEVDVSQYLSKGGKKPSDDS